ncbi:uncharacterized protein JCM6883_005102 [Sporobolomyces salmoneus]|uniref:uncharacterized protein n=1 Tax=Sporobolomyces salmoneus TaxID=183962 RepID=UPI00317E8899
MASNVWAWIKLIFTVLVFGVLFIGIRFGVAAYNAAISSTKENLQKRGVNVSADGVSVKTDRRALTVEETQDRLQRSLMQGWKSATFSVPWLLQKTTNLGGSKHDKDAKEWEEKHGPKPAKKVQ